MQGRVALVVCEADVSAGGEERLNHWQLVEANLQSKTTASASWMTAHRRHLRQHEGPLTLTLAL